MTEKIWTKQEIREKLIESDRWVEKGVLAIYKFQTESEKSSEQTIDKNNVGFNGVDGGIMSSFAKWLLKGRKLTIKQMRIARKKILKYSGQLARIADIPTSRDAYEDRTSLEAYDRAEFEADSKDRWLENRGEE